MEQTQVRDRDPLRETLNVDDGGFGEMPEQGVQQGKSLAPLEPQGQQQFIVAQHVPVRRQYATFMAKMRALAAAAGDRYVYGWEVKDRRTGRKTWIEGPTIKLANDVAREYGNCSVDVRSYDHGTYWMFYARFVDLETGSNYTRAFQQRKNQNTGMGDADRQADIVFQIGQSKAIRNVVVNVLQTFVDEIVDAAKNSLLDRIGKDPAKAKTWLLKEIERLSIERKFIEAVYGRTAENWTVPDMAKIYTEVRSIAEGMMNAADVYPDPAAAETNEEPQRQQGKGDAKQPAKRKAADKGAEKPAGDAGPKGATINIVDADGKLLGTHTGELKVGDPWSGKEGLYHVEQLGDEEGSLVARVKKQAIVPSSPAKGTQDVPEGFAGKQAPAAEPKPPVAAGKATGPARRKFFSDGE